MSSPLFATTTRFVEAVRLANSIPADKFSLLLARIITKLHTKSGSIFTEAEEAQLQKMLSLSADSLHTVLEGCSYVFEQAAYNRLSGPKLSAELAEANMELSQVEAVQRVWTGEGAAYVAKLREHSLGGPATLQASRWELRLPLETDTATDASALFHLSLGPAGAAADPKPAATGAGDGEVPGDAPTAAAVSTTETLSMQLSKEQLFDLLGKLDKVQEQLDAVTTAS